MSLFAWILAALLVGAAFVLGAWIGHAAAERAHARARRIFAWVLGFRVRVECPGHHATGFWRRDARADYGAALLLDVTVRELVARDVSPVLAEDLAELEASA